MWRTGAIGNWQLTRPRSGVCFLVLCSAPGAEPSGEATKKHSGHFGWLANRNDM
jgi:hypothetical protein